jgi:hypothetical protein
LWRPFGGWVKGERGDACKNADADRFAQFLIKNG